MTARRLISMLGVLALLPFILSAPVVAAPPLTTLTFDELQQQQVNGVSFKGVTFGFEIGGIPSADARYHAFGPGSTTYVQDPSLEGAAAGTLTLTFDRPTTLVEFGIARNCFCVLQSAGAVVDLYRPGETDRLSESVSVTTESLGTFSEAKFNYEGPAIQKVVIAFPRAMTANRFALDSLTFRGNT